MLIFENLLVYKNAFAVNQTVYRFLKENTTIARYVRDQLGRASLSVQLNIAEGSGRFANKDRRNFFIMARSSALECASRRKNFQRILNMNCWLNMKQFQKCYML